MPSGGTNLGRRHRTAGPCRATTVAQLDAHGRPSDESNSWVQPFVRDVEDGCRAGLFVNMPTSALDYATAPSFARGHFRSFLRTDLPGEMIPRARSPRSVAGLPCARCGQRFADERAVQIHYSLTRARGSMEERQMRMQCVSNACPWCARTLMEMRNQRDHLRARATAGACPQCSRVSRAPL